MDTEPGGATFTSQEFRYACGHYLTGVTVVTTRAVDRSPIGVTVNSFTSLSLNPPMVLIALDKRLGSHDAFCAAQNFAVHVLAQEQAALSTRFATRGADKFAGLELRDGLGGVPILSDYLALFECRIVHQYSGGDHTIFAAEVERIQVSPQTRPPLGYFRGRYARLAPEQAVPVPEPVVELWNLGWG